MADKKISLMNETTSLSESLGKLYIPLVVNNNGTWTNEKMDLYKLYNLLKGLFTTELNNLANGGGGSQNPELNPSTGQLSSEAMLQLVTNVETLMTWHNLLVLESYWPLNIIRLIGDNNIAQAYVIQTMPGKTGVNVDIHDSMAKVPNLYADIFILSITLSNGTITASVKVNLDNVHESIQLSGAYVEDIYYSLTVVTNYSEGNYNGPLGVTVNANLIPTSGYPHTQTSLESTITINNVQGDDIVSASLKVTIKGKINALEATPSKTIEVANNANYMKTQGLAINISGGGYLKFYDTSSSE